MCLTSFFSLEDIKSMISLKDLRFYRPSSDSKLLTQFIKFSIGTTSILIGMNL